MTKSEFVYRKPAKQLEGHELFDVYKILRSRFKHQKWWPADSPFEVVLGTILTQNTAWVNVEKAILNLKKANALTPIAIKNLTQRKLAQLIQPSGYFNVKADRIKSFISHLFTHYNGDLNKLFKKSIEGLREELLSIKGIGPETADSIILYAANKPIFVIDAYTKRVFSRHGLYDTKASYEDWQNLFMSHLPSKRALFNDYHAQIVAVAKDYCKTKPQCEGCPLVGHLEGVKLRNLFTYK